MSESISDLLYRLRDRVWPYMVGFALLQVIGLLSLPRLAPSLSPADPANHTLYLWLLLVAVITNLVIGFTVQQIQLRRQAGQVLQRNSARLEEAQRIAKIGHWEWDVASQQLFWSAELFRIFGRDPELFSPNYQDFLAAIHPEDRHLVEEAVEEALDGRKAYKVDHRIRLPNGTEKIIQEKGEVVRDAGGKVRKMMGTAQDITARKKAEEEQRLRMQLLTLNAEIGVALTRDQPLEQILLEWCQAVVRNLDAALARIWLIPDHQAVLALAASAGLHTRLDGEFSRVPIDPRTKIGDIALHRQPKISNNLLNDPQIRNPKWVQENNIKGVAGHPLMVAGKVVGVLAFFTRHHLPDFIIPPLATVADIIALGLERKQAENRLQIQARIVEQIRDAIITTDAEGLIATWNNSAQRLFGYGYQEALRRPLSFILAPHELDFFQQRVMPKVREKLSHQVEMEIQTKQGEVRHADLSLTMIDRETATGGGLICCARDISERKKSEEKIRLSSRYLEDTSEAVIITDAEAKIIEVNKAFERVTGYSREEAIGQNPRILKSGHYDAKFYQEMWHTLLTTGHWEGEIWSRRKNNELYPKWLSISAVTDQRGRTTHYVGVSTDLTAIKQTQDKLEELAHYDQLTSLPNSLLFRDRLQQAMTRARRENHKVALLLFDLDRFKEVNDTLGHNTGDTVLTEVAQRLRRNMEGVETISRPGGDEFFLLLDKIRDIDQVVQAAQKVLALFSEPYRVDEHELYLTPSIGITLFPDDDAEVGNLIKNAETAMYHAKKDSGNSFQFFQQSMFADALTKMTMKNRLRQAVEFEEFELYYQPKICADGKSVCGAEALIRWVRPDRRPVSPAEFIPLAEETGLIIPIGEWVLRQACRQSLLWQQAGLPPIRIAVNLSAAQFKQPNFKDDINWILNEIGLPAELLELEITESLLMDDVAAATATMQSLKEMGIHLALDDFGTGYSSLSYLKRFPLDSLKIDRAFVKDISTDDDDRAVIITIITLAHSLKMQVVAEGVETADQVAFLQGKGCDTFQGYYFSKPLPAKEFEEFLRQRLQLPE